MNRSLNTSRPSKGYFKCGIPYTRIGSGPRTLIVFQGLVLFENKPQPFFTVAMYKFLGKEYTVYVAGYKPRRLRGYTLKDMSDDYAGMIREEFGGPVDVIGVSTGGSIAQHFAADHRDLLRKLVIQSSACSLSRETKALQMRIGELAKEKRWIRANAEMLAFMMPRKGVMKVLAEPMKWLGAAILSLGAPHDPSDVVATVEAEDAFDFERRLPEITAPTLIAGGGADPFYTEELFRKTAQGLPNSKLAVYAGMGHPAMGKRFERDVLAFFED